MFKSNASANVYLATGKASADPDDLNWVVILENWPAWFRQVDNQLPYRRPDGTEFLYEYEIFLPMSDGPGPQLLLLVRSARLIVEVDLGIFGTSQWSSVDIQWDGTQVKILANKIDEQDLPD